MALFKRKKQQAQRSPQPVAQRPTSTPPAPVQRPKPPPPSDPLANSEFVYTESFRHTAEPEDAGPNELIPIYALIRQAAGIPLGGAVLTNDDVVASPAQIMARSLVRGSDGFCYLAGSLAPSALGLPAMADVTSHDGRNMVWADQAPVLGTFMLQPSFVHRFKRVGAGFTTPYASAEANAVAVAPDDSTVAVFDHITGSDFVIRVLDRATGTLKMAIPTNGSGAEDLFFSGDSKWLLVDAWTGGSKECINLIHVESGRGMSLDLDRHFSLNWLPAAGPSTLIGSRRKEGESAFLLFTYDLATGNEETIGSIDIHPGTDLGKLSSIRPDATGSRLLALTYAGITPEHQQEHGGRSIVTMVDLESMAFEAIKPQFLDAVSGAQRDHRSPRWLTETKQDSPMELAPDLEAQLTDVATDVPPGWSERLASTARHIVQHSMMAVSGEAGRECPSLITSMWGRAMKSWAQYARADYMEVEEGVTDFISRRAILAIMESDSDPDVAAVNQMHSVNAAAREDRAEDIDTFDLESVWLK